MSVTEKMAPAMPPASDYWAAARVVFVAHHVLLCAAYCALLSASTGNVPIEHLPLLKWNGKGEGCSWTVATQKKRKAWLIGSPVLLHCPGRRIVLLTPESRAACLATVHRKVELFLQKSEVSAGS